MLFKPFTSTVLNKILKTTFHCYFWQKEGSGLKKQILIPNRILLVHRILLLNRIQLLTGPCFESDPDPKPDLYEKFLDEQWLDKRDCHKEFS